MTKTARTGLLTASLVLVGAALTGCSGGAADVSEKDFCQQLNSVFVDVGLGPDATQQKVLARIKEWARDTEELGTPADIPDDARDGFEQMTAAVAALDPSSTLEDFTNLDESLSADERADTAALEAYVADTCGTPEVPTPPAG